jgi:sec-independent protein translocase protein TatB
MLLVGLIALLVFGPERLPKVAREAALWIKKARAMANSVKQEIDREMQLQEMKDALDKQKRDVETMLLAQKTEKSPPPQEGSHE